MARYEIDHQGHIVESKTELCKDKDGMIISLFSQFGWSVEKVNKEGPYMQLKLSKIDFEDVFVNVFSGNVRNEDYFNTADLWTFFSCWFDICMCTFIMHCTMQDYE